MPDGSTYSLKSLVGRTRVQSTYSYCSLTCFIHDSRSAFYMRAACRRESQVESRGGDFSYDVISLADYKVNKPIKFDWLEKQFDLMGDCEVLADITEATATTA